VFLNNTETSFEELVPRLKAIADARGGGTSERVLFRADKASAYGAAARVMGLLSSSGFNRIALVTEVEQK
jgi:biopolymer transport protein TolR